MPEPTTARCTLSASASRSSGRPLRLANEGASAHRCLIVIRRTTALVLTACCGILFAAWLVGLIQLLAGRTSFGGGGQPIEYISFSTIGLVSGFGLYAGIRTLLARSATKPPAEEGVKPTDTGRPMRVVGWILVSFGLAGVEALVEARAQATSFDGLIFIVYGVVFCLGLGGSCLYAFRKRPTELAPSPAKRRWQWPAVAAMLAVTVGVAAWTLWFNPHASEEKGVSATGAHQPATRLQITLPGNVGSVGFPSVSPDGHWLAINVAFVPEEGLWIYDLRTAEWRKLPGTEGSWMPFWSPDSRFLAFGVGKPGREGQLKKIEIAGGSPQILCTSPQGVYGGSWSRDGVILFGSGNGPIYQVPAAGGIPAEVTYVDGRRGENEHSSPIFLPDGKHFLYFRRASPGASGIYAGSLDSKPGEQSQQPVLLNYGLGFQYAEGHLFFLSEVPSLFRVESILMAQPFDADSLQLRGQPAVVAEHVMTFSGDPSVSTSGSLAYLPYSERVYRPTWLDRSGKVIGAFGELHPDEDLKLSPDGSQAAVTPPQQSQNIWLLDTPRGFRMRLTSREAGGTFPVWSPDGSRMVFASGNEVDHLDTLYEKAASGGDESELLKGPGEKNPTSWSPDGRFLLYDSLEKGRRGLWVLPLDGPNGVPRKPVRLLASEVDEYEASFSPDGRWIAYTHYKWPRPEIYVRRFIASGNSQPTLGADTWQVSLDGGERPRWRSDGKEIVFRTPRHDALPMMVKVATNGADFQVVEIARALFTPPPNNGWDVTADGQRFLMLVAPAEQNRPTPVTVVLNWQAALKQ
jgi:Tol biopolymer transport system component